MTKQRLHSNLAEIDVLTRSELGQELNGSMDRAMRERYIGLELQRIPEVTVTATATTVNCFAGNDATPWGPEQGDVWMLRRVVVKSSSFTDNAQYILFRGSTPSDIANGYTPRQLLDGLVKPVAGVTQPTPPAITVGASPFTFVNTQSYGVNVTVSGGTVSAIAVNGQTTGATSGTFYLAPNSYITVTYSVAPTMTEANATANIAAVPMGQNVNIGYYPGNKAVYLQPGEQVYALVQNATIGFQYTVSGEAIRCIAEMKGKIL
jgi:hypothetical protein